MFEEKCGRNRKGKNDEEDEKSVKNSEVDQNMKLTDS